jgi:hypothetical protein
MAAGDLITGDVQIEWRGLVLGASPLYGIKSIEGLLDLPSQRIGIEARSGRHGAYPGQLLSDHRTITAELLLRGMPAVFQSGVNELRRVTASPENADEEEFVIQWDGMKLLAMARCVRRAIPATYNKYPMGIAPASIQWVAADPRLLQLPSQFLSTSLAVASGGLVFPLVFPLDFGAGQQGGTIQLTNTGNADAFPIFTIRGPATAPAILDNTSGKRLGFKSSTVVPAGEQWEVDTNHRTVTILGTTITRNAELQDRQWISIPPGETHLIQFTSTVYDPAAQLSALTYNTYL